MQAWTAPISAVANPYQGGWLSEQEKRERIEELRIERADAIRMLAEARAAGDDEAARCWTKEIARITFDMEG